MDFMYAQIYSPMSGGGFLSRNIFFALLKPLQEVAVGICENCIGNASFAFTGLSSVTTLLVANSLYNSLMNGESFASETCLAAFGALGVGVMATIINWVQPIFMFDDHAIHQGLQSVVWKSRPSNISHRPVLHELVRAR